MILVAGLAIAGLAGIAAAFYFSVRPGTGSSRGRAAGSGRTGTDRTPASRSRTFTPPSRLSRSGPTAGRSRSDPDADFEGPSGRHGHSGHLTAGHRGHRDGSPGPGTDHTVPVGARSAAAGSRPRPAERPDREADATPDAATRARRRVGFRKGAEVDEELWPTEAFGGVSDEQFWDDMASDKPLTTTARTATAAQADPGSRRRLPDVAPVPVPNGRDDDVRGHLDGGRIGSGSYPPPAGRPGPADRTGIQPIQTGPQRIQTGPHPVSTGAQPARSYQPGTQAQPYQGPAQSYQPATQPAPVMGGLGQGVRGGLSADPRGRARHANGTDAGTGPIAGEDPLTSAAYALRPPGAVDGRSYQPRRSRDLTREQYEAAVSQETQSFSLSDAQAATGGYPGFRQYELPAGGGPSGPNSPNGNGRGHDGGRSDAGRYDGLRSDPLRTDPYRSVGRPDPLRGAGTADAYGSSTNGHPYPERPYNDPAQSASTPPYGETYGYGYPVSPVDDPRQPNGTRGQGRSDANGNGTGSGANRPAYPAGNGYRSPYDPRANDRG
jgi:hypothetical protein